MTISPPERNWLCWSHSRIITYTTGRIRGRGTSAQLALRARGAGFMPGGYRHAIGLTRRELLQVGYSGLLGIGLPTILGRQAEAGARAARGAQIASSTKAPAKSVILIFL